MDQRTKSIIIGAVVLLILAASLGTIFYLGKVSRTENVPDSSGDSLSRLRRGTSPSPLTSTPSGQLTNLKQYSGNGFLIRYPSNWGILTCNNSENFEFDPQNPTDERNVRCDFAVKPVTVIVGGTEACSGETIVLGNNQVAKSKVSGDDGSISYGWCLNVGGRKLDITHRVAPIDSRATSKTDFSSQIEEMIKLISPTTTGS